MAPLPREERMRKQFDYSRLSPNTHTAIGRILTEFATEKEKWVERRDIKNKGRRGEEGERETIRSINTKYKERK